MARSSVPHSIGRCLFALLLTQLALVTLLNPIEAAEGAMELPGARNFEEIRITDGDLLQLLEGNWRLEGNVELQLIAASEQDEDVTVKADRIDFLFDEETDELSRIVATGNVSFTMQASERELRAQRVTWLMAENKVEFHGNPEAVIEGGTMTGESIIYYIEEDRAVVKRPRGAFPIPDKEDKKEEGKAEEEGTE